MNSGLPDQPTGYFNQFGFRDFQVVNSIEERLIGIDIPQLDGPVIK